MNAVFVINNELNGIEIKFDGIPTEAVRNELKNNNFRWHRVKKIWYAKQNDERLELAKKLTGAEKKEVKVVTENELGIKVGDVFVMSWGYEQTNVDFFQVVKLCGKKSVRIREVNLPMVSERAYTMGADRTYEVVSEILPPSSFSVHIKDQENGDLKRVSGTKEYPFINMTSYANAYVYHGEEVNETWYA